MIGAQNILAIAHTIGTDLALVLTWTFLALIWMHVMRVFKSDSVNGPIRMTTEDHPGRMLWFAFFGFMGYQFLIALLGNGQLKDNHRMIYSQVSAAVLAIPAVVLVDRAIRPRQAHLLGFSGRNVTLGFVPGVLGFLTVVPLVLVVSMLMQIIAHLMRKTEPVHRLLEIWNANPDFSFRLLIVIAAVALAPIFEELLFRGFLQTAFSGLCGSRWWGIVLASAIFAAVHGEWLFLAPLFVLAMGLGYLYERTGNLWACIFLHAMFNGMQITIFAINQSQPSAGN